MRIRSDRLDVGGSGLRLRAPAWPPASTHGAPAKRSWALVQASGTGIAGAFRGAGKLAPSPAAPGEGLAGGKPSRRPARETERDRAAGPSGGHARDRGRAWPAAARLPGRGGSSFSPSATSLPAGGGRIPLCELEANSGRESEWGRAAWGRRRPRRRVFGCPCCAPRRSSARRAPS